MLRMTMMGGRLFPPVSSSTVRNVAAGLAIATPMLAIAQGGWLLAEYRMYHGDAPHPVSPSRGVVVVSPRDAAPAASSTSRRASIASLGAPMMATSCEGSVKAELSNSGHDSSLEKANDLPPLRLLVIGDSLAAGVGTSRSATPVLPESIARSLSKALGGRAVYWTCRGVPGASAGRIVQEIERVVQEDHRDDHNDAKDDKKGKLVAAGGAPVAAAVTVAFLSAPLDEIVAAVRRGREWVRERRQLRKMASDDQQDGKSPLSNPFANAAAWKSLRDDSKGFLDAIFNKQQNSDGEQEDSVEKTENEDEDVAWVRWRAKLARQLRKDKDRTQPQPDKSSNNNHAKDDNKNPHFDVAVVLTGVNDLKEAFLPFMMKKAGPNDDTHGVEGDDNEKDVDGRFQDELVRILDVLKGKMSSGLQKIQRHETAAEEYLSDEHVADLSKAVDQTSANSLLRRHLSRPRHRPLVVLPAMPIEPVPVFQYAPFRWFAVPLITALEAHKRALAEANPGSVLFVDAPTLCQIDDIEKGKSPLNAMRSAEEVLVALRDVTRLARDRVQTVMDEHYSRLGEWAAGRRNHEEEGGDMEKRAKEEAAREEEKERQYEEAYLHHRLVQLSTHWPGSQLISADRVHPNDEGYDFWGRHIAGAILQEWRKEID